MKKGNLSYKHAEAFNWMYYSTKDGTSGYWIYNSRDGVTPFCTPINGVLHTHEKWGNDLHAPEYKPKEGDLVWRSITREEAENAMRERIKLMPEYTPPDPEATIKAHGDDCIERGEPTLAKVAADGQFIKFKR